MNELAYVGEILDYNGADYEVREILQDNALNVPDGLALVQAINLDTYETVYLILSLGVVEHLADTEEEAREVLESYSYDIDDLLDEDLEGFVWDRDDDYYLPTDAVYSTFDKNADRIDDLYKREPLENGIKAGRKEPNIVRGKHSLELSDIIPIFKSFMESLSTDETRELTIAPTSLGYMWDYKDGWNNGRLVDSTGTHIEPITLVYDTVDNIQLFSGDVRVGKYSSREDANRGIAKLTDNLIQQYRQKNKIYNEPLAAKKREKWIVKDPNSGYLMDKSTAAGCPAFSVSSDEAKRFNSEQEAQDKINEFGLHLARAINIKELGMSAKHDSFVAKKLIKAERKGDMTRARNKRTNEYYSQADFDKLTRELLAIEDVEWIEYDTTSFINGEEDAFQRMLIVLVGNGVESTLDFEKYFDRLDKLFSSLNKVFRDNGLRQADPMEDNDSYFYFVLSKVGDKPQASRRNILREVQADIQRKRPLVQRSKRWQ